MKLDKELIFIGFIIFLGLVLIFVEYFLAG